MNIRRMISVRFCLSLCAALSVAGMAMAQRDGQPANLDGAGVVFVYYPSICTSAGKPENCKELPQPSRPAFESMAACSAHAEIELGRSGDPKLMATCMKLRES